MLCSYCQHPTRPIKARGMCNNCYVRWNRTGDASPKRMKRGMCTVEGCDHKAHGRGLCDMHIRRQKIHGTLEAPVREKPLGEYDLYPQWVDFQRLRNPRPVVAEWKTDFFTFLAAVGDRPSKQYRLYRLDKGKPMGPGNFEWRSTLVPKLEGESKRDYNMRASKAHRAQFPDDYRNNDLTRMYGISLAQYNAMSEAQGHKCAICNKPETYFRYGKLVKLAVDHNHTTLVVRGLLCQSCNKAVGLLYEDRIIVAALDAYLAKHA